MSERQLKNAKYAGRPSMCRDCGALVGPAEENCSLCGAPRTSTGAVVQAQPPERVHDNETMRFARAILSRPYIFTIIFLIANVFVFLLMWSSSELNSTSLWEPQHSVLIAYGAKLNSLINGHGQWWRFVTPVFVHIGLAHLLVNMYGLWMLGPYVERLYGSAKFVVLWVMTGIAGVVASYLTLRPDLANGSVGRFLFKSSDNPSAGASGALFGLIGVLFVFGIKFRRELPDGFKRAFGTGLLPVILINLFIGYLGRGYIDNAAHLGGLISGTLFGLMIGYKRPDEPPRIALVWHILQVASLAVVLVSFIMVARSFNNSYPELSRESATSTVGTDPAVKQFIEAINGGQGVLLRAMEKAEPNGIEDAVKQLDAVSPPDQTAGELREELKSLLLSARDFLAEPPTKGPKARPRAQLQEKLEEPFSAWVKKRDRWVETEGGKYRISVTTDKPSEGK